MQFSLKRTLCFSGQVHLWLTKFSDLELSDPYLTSILSPKELQRSQNFLDYRHAQCYVAAHGILRYVLSHYAPVPPQIWAFENSLHGKPHLINAEASDLSFNLSYTNEYIACVISRKSIIGIDIERIRPIANIKNQIKRYCSSNEQRVLSSLPASQMQQHFFKLWTIKEAFVKARGTGLTYPIRLISADLSQEPKIRVTVNEMDKETPWYFELRTVENNHFVSIAYCNRPRLKQDQAAADERILAQTIL